MRRLAALQPAGNQWELIRISAAQCAAEAIAGFDRGAAMVFPGQA